MADDGQAPEGLDKVLNRECFCITLDGDSLLAAIRAEASDPDLASALLAGRPNLFAGMPVFLAASDLKAMLDVVGAVEAAAQDPTYQAAVLAWAPEIARRDFGPHGVFMGHDFHLGPGGPKLIEINTNAGGAFLNAFLGRAQGVCCGEVRDAVSPASVSEFEAAVWSMFLEEWRSQGRVGPPRTLAIVDAAPSEQYLFPEFLLAQRFFERHGLECWIADPAELAFVDGRLMRAGRAIDMVYNRLVDFSLDSEGHQALREAYLAQAVVLTPNPRNHALFADKRNLTVLSDHAQVDHWRLTSQQRQSLAAAVPRTVVVTSENAEGLWAARKGYFFKPAAGHGGKAVYRGDKMTRGVWDDIRRGGYIAQALASPTERRIRVDGEVKALKLDVRLFTYRGRRLLTAARVYQGQTTNFRTPGGGFAPVFVT
jgi:hypothetical protein